MLAGTDPTEALVHQAFRRARTETDPAVALTWLDRAHRLAPNDAAIALALASAHLQAGAFAAAAALFQQIADRTGSPEAWVGLGTCAHRLGRTQEARHSAAAALRCSVPHTALIALADAVAEAWCGLTTDGVLVLSAPATEVTLDGVPLRARRDARRISLPPAWRSAGELAVFGESGPMLGSPLPVRQFTMLEGLAEARAGGIAGWAWYPADPGRNPRVTATGLLSQRQVLLTVAAKDVQLLRPLARPRRLILTAGDVAELGEPVSLTGPDGRDLLGSPLEPGLEARAVAGVDRARFSPVWADVVVPPPRRLDDRPPAAVVIPVYRGAAETLACIASVLAGTPRGVRIVVVDDASPDRALAAALARLARRGRITLIRLPHNRGFPGAANAGLLACAGQDAVLLNSDTLVPPGWLDRLRDAAYGAPAIATVTPLTNDGTILGYPDPGGPNPMPGLAATIALDRLAQRANAGQTAEVPVGVGFCLYIRRAALDAAGPLREDLFAQGYGEENDFCLRARHHGFHHVAALDVFVAHAGATSFGGAREHLARRNAAILERLHPGYGALIDRTVAHDPLHSARRRIDLLRWAAARRAGAVILVTHGKGGGVERVVHERAAAIARDGLRPVILRPAPGGLRVEAPGGEPFPNLRFDMPAGLPALVRLLRGDRPRTVELHHLLGHHPAVAGLARMLRVEAVSVVHDYARFCARIALVGAESRYCGEPDVTGCEACIADLGSLLEDDTSVPDLIARSGSELRGADRVLAPSDDAATRIGRHFPGVLPETLPWEDDARLPPLAPAPRRGPVRIVVVGAIGIEKGFEVLLACARDARARGLPIEFVVAGYTCDDKRLLASGPVHITGEYAEAEATELIRAQQAHLAFLPSVWPETWCFALSRAWQAGLPAAVFDLGAPAARVRRTGRGWVLPFGLPARPLNDTLLRLAPGRPASQCPAR